MLTSETFETIRSNVGNIWKTSVEPRTQSKFFLSTSEIFRILRVNFGNIRKYSVRLRKSSDYFGSTSESSDIFGINSGIFRILLVNFSHPDPPFQHHYISSTAWLFVKKCLVYGIRKYYISSLQQWHTFKHVSACWQLSFKHCSRATRLVIMQYFAMGILAFKQLRSLGGRNCLKAVVALVRTLWRKI